MTPFWALDVISLLVALAIGWLVPAWAVRRLLPGFEKAGGAVANYRGRKVAPGLGVVWAVWAATIGFVGLVSSGVALSLASSGAYAHAVPAWAIVLSAPLFSAIPYVPVTLVLGVFAFGLIDDAYGSAGSRGFRGHLRELAHGRLTTGSLKMLGIGALALVSAQGAALRFARTLASSGAMSSGLRLAEFGVTWLCGALLIALTANFVNLTDLRPGRALKAYTGLVVLALVAVAWAVVSSASPAAGGSLSASVTILCLGVFALGPVFAVWRFDVGERAMLGDAGANAAGAFAAYLVVVTASLWVIVGAAVVMLALNIVSERVSFTSVIESRRWLRWIDRLGRLPEEPAGGVVGNRGTDRRDPRPTHVDRGRDGGSRE